MDAILTAALLAAPLACDGVSLERRDTPFTLNAEWSPIARSAYGFHLDRASGLADVLDPGPAVPSRTYGWDAIAPLLPPEGAAVGDVWRPDVEPVVELLRQLHPAATAKLHHHHAPVTCEDPGRPPELGAPLARAPLGARATLLADGPVVDVLLRAHVEFHLRDGTVFYTPGQFEGRLVVDPGARRVVALHLAVPDRDSNVDINVHDGERETGLVDIGHVPRLGLSTDAAPPELDAAALEAARLRLRRAFYDFARIEWLSLDEGVAPAASTDRPLHVVRLMGTLDDASC